MCSKRLRAAVFGTMLLGSLPAPAASATVIGTLSTPGIVWISDGNTPHPASAEMRNVNKSFVPDLLVVPVGSTVRFPNDDPFFHSIYSSSDPNAFDIGFYLTGPGKDITFTHQGVVDVHCHIHVFMHAHIIVVDGPSVRTDTESFTLENVRPGRHAMHAWSPGGGLRSTSVSVPSNGTLTLTHAL